MNAINGPVECMQRCVAEAIQEVIDLTGFLCFLFRSTPSDRSLWADYNDVGLISTPVPGHDKELMMAPARRAGATADVILF